MKLNQLRGELLLEAKNLVGKHLSDPYTHDLHANDKRLTSLEGCPKVVKGNFDCSINLLTSLEHGPSIIHGWFDCSRNQLASLKYCPSIVHNWFDCRNNELKSLEGIHKHLKEMNGNFYAIGNPIKSHVLGLFLVKGCNGVALDNTAVEVIMNKWLPKGRAGLISCQNELIAAGLEEYAQL